MPRLYRRPAEIVLDALPDARFRGRISRMVPTVDRATAPVMTKVRFDALAPRILRSPAPLLR